MGKSTKPNHLEACPGQALPASILQSARLMDSSPLARAMARPQNYAARTTPCHADNSLEHQCKLAQILHRRQRSPDKLILHRMYRWTGWSGVDSARTNPQQGLH